MKQIIFFRDQSITAKLFFGVGLMIGVCLVIAGAGHLGFYRLNQEAEILVEKRWIPAIEFVDMKADLMEARAVLMALIYEKDSEKQKKKHRQIDVISAHLDKTLDLYEHSEFIRDAQKKKIVEFKKIWNEFKNTREHELIPFIFQGNIDSALMLATGIQAERLAEMSRLSNSIIESVKGEAFSERKKNQAMSSALVRVFWMISLLGISAAMILNGGLNFYISSRLKRVVGLAKKLARGDLSERLSVDSQDELGQMSEALNQAVEEMHQLILSIQKSAEDLKNSENLLLQSEKMSAVGQLAAGVAHEINNPLGVILGFSQSVVKRIQPGDPLELPLRSIEREAMRCKNLVWDLLTFSRTEKGGREPVDLKEAIEGALSLVLAQTKVKNIELVKELSEVPEIIGGKNQIQQVIVNLSNNAMDAMPSGGKLIIRLKKSKMDDLAAVEIQVEDTGQGIPAEIRSKIFDPFFTTKEIGKGTGLGLSLVFEIIQKHGGKITLESELGKGTVFHVLFPISEQM